MRLLLNSLDRCVWGRAWLPVLLSICLVVCVNTIISPVYAQSINQTHIITAPSAQQNKDGQFEFSLESDQWGEHAQLD